MAGVAEVEEQEQEQREMEVVGERAVLSRVVNQLPSIMTNPASGHAVYFSKADLEMMDI